MMPRKPSRPRLVVTRDQMKRLLTQQTKHDLETACKLINLLHEIVLENAGGRLEDMRFEDKKLQANVDILLHAFKQKGH